MANCFTFKNHYAKHLSGRDYNQAVFDAHIQAKKQDDGHAIEMYNKFVAPSKSPLATTGARQSGKQSGDIEKQKMVGTLKFYTL